MERLQTKREVTRAELNRLNEELERLTTADDFGPQQRDLLAEISDELDIVSRDLKQLDALIEPHVRDEGLAEEYKGVRQCQALMTRMRTKLRRCGETNSNGATSTLNAEETASRLPAARSGQLRLPKLELQKFSGNKLDWQPFWQQFRQAVHENTGLTSIEKFLYLRTALTGKAAAALTGVQATEMNYDYAVKTLQERFGRQDVLVQEHLTQLLNLPQVRALSDVNALRRLHDHVQRNIAGLETLGVKSDSYGAMLCAALFRVLPAEWAVEYHKAHSADKDVLDSSSLQAILQSVRLEVESREKAHGGSTNAPQQTRPDHASERRPNSVYGKGSAASLQVGAKSSKERCPFCASERHEVADCNAPISIDEKKRKLRKEGRCYRCAKKGHMTKGCKNWTLRCAKCGRRHITSLCDPPEPNAEGETATGLHSTASLSNSNKNAVLLQTAQVWVNGTKRKRLARCLFDGGSQRSFITEKLSRILDLEVIGEEEVTIYPFGGSTNVIKKKRRRVKLRLRSQYDRKEHSIEALEIEEICSDQLLLPENAVEMSQVADLKLADVTISPTRLFTQGIEVLIGSDYYWTFVHAKVKKVQGPLVALKTDFGWTLQGPIPLSAAGVSCSTIAVLRTSVCDMDANLSDELRAFWELESLGISSSSCLLGSEEQQVREDFTRSLTLADGRYEASLPWKALDQRLASNEVVARESLAKLKPRLRLSKSRLVVYDAAIRDYLDEGFAEKVPADEIDSTLSRVYYMPHRAVFRFESSTTKVRIVFDESSKAQGCLSLNDALTTGPNLKPDLLRLTLNFRCHKIALTADIEKAFLQIGIESEDRDALRFLWYSSTSCEGSSEGDIEVWRMTRVPFSTTSGPFILAATIRHPLANISEDLSHSAQILGSCLYVGDLIAEVSNAEEATKFNEEAQQILSSAGMKLRKYISNNELLRQFDADGVGNTCADTATTTSAMARVLGLVWDRGNDELKYSLKTALELLTVNRNTKRFVIHATARIFDPLGLLSPITITAQASLPVIEIKRFSNLNRLQRVTAWMRRFVRNCDQKRMDLRACSVHSKSNRRRNGRITEEFTGRDGRTRS